MDVLQLLKKDHKKVKRLFREFEKLGRSAQKKHTLVQQIHRLLSAHMQLEQEIVYPALRKIRSDEVKALLQEAHEEQQVTKILLAELGELQPGDEHYDAKVKVMSEYVQHYVKEEEKELLSLAQKHCSRKRWEELSAAVEARQHELMEGAPSTRTTRQAA